MPVFQNGAKTTTVITIVERHELEFDGLQIKRLLLAAGFVVPEKCDLRIYIAIPGGGDWSNTDIEISNEHPLCVEWTTTVERKS
jgi:hypothetical protein